MRLHTKENMMESVFKRLGLHRVYISLCLGFGCWFHSSSSLEKQVTKETFNSVNHKIVPDCTFKIEIIISVPELQTWTWIRFRLKPFTFLIFPLIICENYKHHRKAEMLACSFKMLNIYESYFLLFCRSREIWP